MPKDLCLAGRIAEATGIEISWERPRKGALSGACVAFDYAVGRQYLLLLKTSGPEPVVLSPPFARVNEEVSGRDDPWVVGIERYIAISKLLTFEERNSALQDLRARAEPESELHKDITAFLDHPWPGKPAAALARYLAPGIEIPETRRALYLLAGQPPEESRHAVDELLASSRAQQLVSPLAELRGQTWPLSVLEPAGRSGPLVASGAGVAFPEPLGREHPTRHRTASHWRSLEMPSSDLRAQLPP